MSLKAIEVGAAPVPAGARRVVVFGGTFDPPHRGHIELPIAARDALGADWLLYVVAGRSPHKKDGPAASAAARIDMLRAALVGRERVSISDWEVVHAAAGPSYMVETLRGLRDRLGAEVRLRLLIGADQAAVFHRWREPREIMALAEPAVMLRAPFDTREALARAMAAHWSADETVAWGRRMIDVPMCGAAATDVRGLLAREGVDNDVVRQLIPGAVLSVIRERGLYETR